jgi:predicted amidohydrolase
LKKNKCNEDVNLIVLPEMFTTGFYNESVKGHKDKVKCRYENRKPKNAAITGSD